MQTLYSVITGAAGNSAMFEAVGGELLLGNSSSKLASLDSFVSPALCTTVSNTRSDDLSSLLGRASCQSPSHCSVVEVSLTSYLPRRAGSAVRSGFLNSRLQRRCQPWRVLLHPRRGYDQVLLQRERGRGGSSCFCGCLRHIDSSEGGLPRTRRCASDFVSSPFKALR